MSTLYRDTVGYATCGIGHLVYDPEDSQKLPWRHRDLSLATPAEAMADFHRVMAMPKGLTSEAYATEKSLHLLPDDQVALAQRRLDTEFLPAIRKLMPGFDGFPAGPRSALVDMAWNLGVGGLGLFHRMIESCNRRDWAEAAAQSHRRSCRPERNAWTEGRFLSDVGGEYQST